MPEELKTWPEKKSKPSKAEKPKKEDTRFVTYKLYKQGKNLKEIAKERDLHKRTVYGHLAHFVAKGMLPVTDFVSEGKCRTIRGVISETGILHGLAAIKKACPEDITYEEIIMVIASMEAE